MTTEVAARARSLVWAGWVVTGLVTAFLIFDGGTKVLQIEPVLEASARVGLDPGQVLLIGTILLACTALYVAPRTRVVGVVLLTGYLGGAVATHIRAGSSVFETVFPIGFGGLAWLGLVLRDRRLLSTMVPSKD